jgi:hypothetical protein
MCNIQEILAYVKDSKEDTLEKLVKELQERPKTLADYKRLTVTQWQKLHGPASVFVFKYLKCSLI